jgi:hypothetical protein
MLRNSRSARASRRPASGSAVASMSVLMVVLLSAPSVCGGGYYGHALDR